MGTKSISVEEWLEQQSGVFDERWPEARDFWIYTVGDKSVHALPDSGRCAVCGRDTRFVRTVSGQRVCSEDCLRKGVQ